ncbi:MAG TPA: restriction endonuclease [Dissulfurispiraceae bacterium]|nr:restriction endonuclease [Dissulfurispiraceae bacterium]
MTIPVTKASGKSEEFDIGKLVNSLVRSGAPEDVAWDIAGKVSTQVTHSMHTHHIFRMAKKLLRQYSRSSGMRYSIKKAIYSLGPTGYPFEKYVARILKAYGYSVEVNRIIKGFCVTHEVDVLATLDDKRCMIECKHHAGGEKPADIKIALYVHARFEDIRKAFDIEEHRNSHVQEDWLVTNTRCSSDAIKFAECVGLKVLSWRYPEKMGLEKMIEGKRLYPITILPAATRNTAQTLTSRDIILVDEISSMDVESLMRAGGLDNQTATLLKRQANELCSSASCPVS